MILVYSIYLYLLSGIIPALWFVFRKIQHLDHSAEKTSLGFKLIILPGCILLWPILLLKIYKS